MTFMKYILLHSYTMKTMVYVLKVKLLFSEIQIKQGVSVIDANLHKHEKLNRSKGHRTFLLPGILINTKNTSNRFYHDITHKPISISFSEKRHQAIVAIAASLNVFKCDLSPLI